MKRQPADRVHSPGGRTACGRVLVSVLLAVWLAAFPARAFTVVIDPGHGGHDHGAKGERVCEKDINLAVATRVGKLIKRNMKEVEVVFTRSSDKFIPLQGRCDIANRAKGDIFVSIHTNSVAANSPSRKTVSGASVYTLGLSRADTNLDVAMRENSVMKLEDDYTTTYSGFDPSSAESYIVFELTQSAHLDRSVRLARELQRELVATAGRRDMGVRQAPFWVLVRTSMPAVLVELDFVCNPTVEEFLGSDRGRDKLAESIFKGIKAYYGSTSRSACVDGDTATAAPGGDGNRKAKKDRKEKKDRKKSTAPADAAAPDAAAPDEVVYKIQFLTSPRRLDAADKRLKDLDDVDCYLDGGVVKYTVGAFPTVSAAQKRLREMKRRFPDAFVIKTQGGKRIK